jgi:malonyl-CoA O-methyltransferase
VAVGLLVVVGMNDELAAYALDPIGVRRSFDRAAATFDAAAVLHAEVRGNLLQRLQLAAFTPRVVVDLGAGTGHVSRALKRRYPDALVIALDSSSGMLRAAARRRSWLRRFALVRANAEHLPLANGSVDLILSNLMLQWCNPDAVFAECRRVLAPRGLLSFTTLGPDTLRELRTAWARADSCSHVHQFIDMHDLGDALVRCGFASPVLDVEHYTLTYSDFTQVAADLKATGAHNATAGRAKGLTGRGKFAAMQAVYETFRQEGRLPATYEVVFGQAWAPDAAALHSSEATRGSGADSTVSLDEIKRQLHSRRRP